MVSIKCIAKPKARSLPACIWMQAGAVRRHECRHQFECTTCRFDRAMMRAVSENRRLRKAGRAPQGKRSALVSWKDMLRARPAGRRACVHHMKGRIDFRLCHHDYHCGDCEFDQYFYDQFAVHTVVRPIEELNIHGIRMPQGFYLHKGHAWVKLEEGSEVRIGVDEFALRLLGPLDRIDAPLMGKELRQDHPDIQLHRGPHRARLRAPVSGVVTAVNSQLREQGSLANQDPYAQGWLLRLHAPQLRQELRQLMIGNESRDFLARELDRLYEVIEEHAGPLAADGGFLGDDIFGNLPNVGWGHLTSAFLGT